MTKNKTEQPIIKLNEDYALTSDGVRNYVIMEKYETRTGVGKNSPLSGEFAYRDLSFHGRSLTSVARKLNEEDMFKLFNELPDGKSVIESVDLIIKELKEREERILKCIIENTKFKFRGDVEDAEKED